jgi:hypothetical protein
LLPWTNYILLISSSWVARITGVIHWHEAKTFKHLVTCGRGKTWPVSDGQWCMRRDKCGLQVWGGGSGSGVNSQCILVIKGSLGSYYKLFCRQGCCWLMPVILSTREAEIRRILVQRKFWTNSLGDPILKKPTIKRLVGCLKW